MSDSKELNALRSDLRNCVLLFAIPLLLLLPFLWNSETLLLSRSELGTDYIAKQLPNASFLQQEWRETGRLPTWRPETMSGIPIVGNPSYLIAYPPYLLILALPATWALNLLFALHIGLAGAGIYAFARIRMAFSGLGAFSSAIAYMLAPKLLAHVSGGQLDIVIVLAWLPWVLLALDRALENLSPIWAWLAGLLFGLLFVAHPPTAFITFTVLIAYALYLLIRHRPAAFSRLRRTLLVRRTFAIGLAAAIGFLLSGGVHLAPMLELIPYLNRSDLSLADSAAYALPPSLLALFLAVPSVPFPEWIVFIGIGIFIFASHGILRDQVWGKAFWLTLGIVSVLFALGTATPLFAWTFRIVPGFGFLRVPSRSWFFVSLILAIFCGAGVQGFVQGRRGFRAAAAIGLFLLVVSGVAISRPQNPWQWVALAAAVVSGATILILSQFGGILKGGNRVALAIGFVLILELSAVGWSFWQPGEGSPEPEWLDQLSVTGTERVYTEGRLSPYAAENAGLWIVEGIDPVQLRHYVSYIEAATQCRPQVYSISVPAFVASAEAAAACPDRQVDSYLLGLLGVRRAVTSEDQTGLGWILEGSIEGGNVYRNNDVRPQAFLIYETQPTVSDEYLFDRLAERSPSDPLLVVGGHEITGGSDGSSSVDTRWITSDQFELEITSSAPGFVVVSVPYMPGWKALDHDRIELPVYQAQMALMGTYVPAGKTNLHFRYSPDSYVLGKWVRGLALIVSAIGFSFVSFQVWDRRRAKR
ncbi:MAG: hypothetical protein ACC647_01240 [Anaerolineales bacterium]